MGQIVLSKKPKLPPTEWNIARVIELHPGPNGLPRVVKVKTESSTFLRPISELALLSIEFEVDQPSESADAQSYD